MKKMLKKAMALVLAVMMIITAVPLTASAETYGDLTYEIVNGEVTIKDCNTSVTTVNIPSTIKGYPVTSISYLAFYECSSLESITIPDSVTSIGDYAFRNCSSLTSITIPDSVTSIGINAFLACSSLTSITVDENNENYSSDEYGVLFNKEKTELIQYPIGNSRTEYTIPDSVTSIGNYAFYKCSILESIIIPDSVTSIGNSAFYDCFSLTSITIPDSVTSIGNWAFYNCSSLESITIPDSVTSIGNYACYNCTSLESITIPDSVTSIGNYAFYYCSSLTSITILNSDCEIYDSEYAIDENATIYGYEGSTAQAYAEKYGREFVALDKECEHNYVEEITTPATCTGKGEKTFTCSVCGDVKTEEIEALGHDWNEITDSYKECNRCGETDGVLAYDTTVTVSNVTGRPGETVEVYVVFDSDTDVKTMSVSGIDYDASKLTLVKGEWLVEDAVIANWDQNKKAGVITFKENTTLSGNVFVLTFKIKDELEDCEVVIDCDFGIKAMNENNVETALAVEVVPGSVTITNIIKGDVNGDDYVDSNDAIHLLYNTMLPDLYEVNQNCDFNGDGYVDSNDAIYLLYYTMLPDIYPLS